MINEDRSCVREAKRTIFKISIISNASVSQLDRNLTIARFSDGNICCFGGCSTIDPFERDSVEPMTFSLPLAATELLFLFQNSAEEKCSIYLKKKIFSRFLRARFTMYLLGSSGEWIRRTIVTCWNPCTSRWRYWDEGWRQYCRPCTLRRFRSWECSGRLHELHLRAQDVSKRTIDECKTDLLYRPR